MHGLKRSLLFIPIFACLLNMPTSAVEVLFDSLNGSTSGTRAGGTFTGGGWRVDGQYDSIYWHVGSYSKGAFEYDVRGLGSNCPGGLGFKNELSHFYDFTFNNADNVYAPGYRDNPFKEFIRKQCEAGKENRLEVVWAANGNFLEDDTSALSWDANATYHWRCEWENSGGNTTHRVFRNGALIISQTVGGSWSPAGQSVRIAASPRRAEEGAHLGAIYTNIRVFDDTSQPPPPPPQGPFGGTARNIPGLIQVEDYDVGGQNVAYNDLTGGNSGGQYRSDDVDVETTGDAGGGFNVGFTDTGEWLEYTVNVNTTGDYAIKARVASAGAGGSIRLALNGANITTVKSFGGTGAWQTYTTIIIPGIFMSSGAGKILRLTVEGGGFNINHLDFAFGGADVISCDLAATNLDDGMNSPIGGDGDTISATIGGHQCRRNMDPSFNDHYYYFAMADIYAFNGNKTAATITLDYYDSGTHTLTLQYDGIPGAYTNGPTITLTNTNTWKTAVLNVGNAYFGNRQNWGSDFRIHVGNIVTYIDTVMVFATVGGGPVTLNNSAFPSNADGWNVVVWHTGPNLDGTMVWQSANGNPTGNMLSNGSGATNNTDTCTREGGEINKAVSTAGYNTVQVVYDVRFETNQTGTTCIGTCPVLEGNCADKLAVYYSTTGTAGPWILLEAVNALSVTQNVWSTRTINVPAAGGNKANFATRFRWQFNQATDGGRLDNVKVIGTP